MEIVIFGAGSIGCYVGAALTKQKMNVSLVGRERLKTIIAQQGGIHISDYQGRSDHVPDVNYTTDPCVLSKADIVLVTLKCTAVEEGRKVLARYCGNNAVIVCLQNGVGSEQLVREYLPENRVLAGIVPFNVLENDGAFHRGTEGSLYLPDIPELHPVQAALIASGIPCEFPKDMNAVIWGKLLLNLNNAINAFADMPLKQQLAQRGYRMLLSACQQELLRYCAAKQIKLAKLTALPPSWLPVVLKLPDWLFQVVAKKMLDIDPLARSSMWEDVQAGKETEIRFLNGKVAELAASVGIAAPANKLVAELLEVRRSGKALTITAEELINLVHELRDE